MDSLKLAFLMLSLSLASCASPRVIGGTIPLITYSPDFQTETSREMKSTCPTVPNMCTMINDYGKTRNAIRALQTKPK